MRLPVVVGGAAMDAQTDGVVGVRVRPPGARKHGCQNAINPPGIPRDDTCVFYGAFAQRWALKGDGAASADYRAGCAITPAHELYGTSSPLVADAKWRYHRIRRDARHLVSAQDRGDTAQACRSREQSRSTRQVGSRLTRLVPGALDCLNGLYDQLENYGDHTIGLDHRDGAE